MADQPSGTVTFVFTDIEGSTRLLSDSGPERYRELLAAHHAVVREAFGRFDGYEVDNQGDAFFYAFPTAGNAVAAARAATAKLEGGPVRVRVGVHTGEPVVDGAGYVGIDVHRAARIMAAAHGGQVVVSQATRDLLGDGEQLYDLGKHRLKDLAAAEQLYQVGDGEFAPLKSLYRTNLPVPATTFIGRDRELGELVSLLQQDAVRLVTLTGPGGTGKTRLALQACAEVADSYPDGVWWVPLASLQDPTLASVAVAEALELRADAGVETRERLAGISGKRLLLLLDNAEHLLPAVAGQIAELAAIDGPDVVVTSRERLQLQGEYSYPVSAMESEDGIDLFAARARQIDPHFVASRTVGDLCARLDELPLALELAAARTSVFSPEQLLERLGEWLDLLQAPRDADPRQQTLRATIDWSYDLLDGEEKRAYRALSVFAGGCTLEAAAEVGGAAPDTIASLIDKSLLRRRDAPSGPRYWMLDTIRAHAAEHARLHDEHAGLESRRADACLALAGRAWRAFTTLGVDERPWVDRLVDERDNMRAALDHYRDSGDAAGVARLCTQLWVVWFFRGDAAEGREWLVKARELGPPDDLRPEVENALAALTDLTSATGALPIARAGVQHAREQNDRLAEVMCLITLGNILTVVDPHEAHAAHVAACTLAAEIGEPWWELTARVVLVGEALNRRDWDAAESDLAACRALLGRGPHVAAIHSVELLEAEIDWHFGRHDAARAHLARALAEARTAPKAAAYNELALAALIAAHDGHHERAAVIAAAAPRLLAELGIVADASDLARLDEIEELVGRYLDAAALATAREHGRVLELDEAIGYALVPPSAE
jgi:predicted ATPase/class 3 adenylate cyclase